MHHYWRGADRRLWFALNIAVCTRLLTRAGQNLFESPAFIFVPPAVHWLSWRCDSGRPCASCVVLNSLNVGSMVLGDASTLDLGGDDVVGASWGGHDMLVVTARHAVRVFKVRRRRRMLGMGVVHQGA